MSLFVSFTKFLYFSLFMRVMSAFPFPVTSHYALFATIIHLLQGLPLSVLPSTPNQYTLIINHLNIRSLCPRHLKSFHYTLTLVFSFTPTSRHTSSLFLIISILDTLHILRRHLFSSTANFCFCLSLISHVSAL